MYVCVSMRTHAYADVYLLVCAFAVLACMHACMHAMRAFMHALRYACIYACAYVCACLRLIQVCVVMRYMYVRI